MDERSTTGITDRVVGLRLQQFQRATGLPIVFGGATARAGIGKADGTGRSRVLRIGHVRGTLGTGLVGLDVRAGRGLGGAVLVSGSPGIARDYASTRSITHDFDAIVVHEERISSVFALPVVVDTTVEAILYGAVRGPHRIGDRVVEQAARFGKRLEGELRGMLATSANATAAAEPPSLRHTHAAIRELAELAGATSDQSRRRTLQQLVAELQNLVATDPARGDGIAGCLAPREVDVLRLVGVGISNADAAASLGLTTETVKAYLRSAMRKLGVGNRTAAAHVARRAGLL